MRITFINANMGYGGAERVIAVLCNQFVKNGHDVRIGIFSTKMSASVYPINKNVIIDWVQHFHYNSLNSILRTNQSIKDYLIETKPDVVICFMNNICAQFSIICNKLKIPLIFSERNDPKRFIVSYKDKILQRILLHNIKYAIFQTKGAMSMYPSRIQKHSKVILNPIDVDRINEDRECDKAKEVLTVGRLEPQKNQKMIIDSFAMISSKHPDYTLKIYGEGSLRNELSKRIFELGLEHKVFLMGNIDNVDEKLRQASIFVLTSDFEGLPNALMEAMVLGLPCVSTDCSPGGARELIEDGINGFIIPCGDTEKLASHLDLLMNDSEMSQRLGRNATKIIEKINSDTIARQWEEFIKGVVNENTKDSK